MPLTEPRTSAEWQDLRKKLRTASAEDYPEVDPADFRKFKKVVVAGSSNLVGLPMIVIVAFLFITEYVLGIVNWGAIGWLLGLVVGAVAGGFLNPWLLERSERKALSLGREIGIFARAGERSADERTPPRVETEPGAGTGPRMETQETGLEPGPFPGAPASEPVTAKRPAGVTVIAVLAIIGGVLVLFSALPYLLMAGRPIVVPSEAFRFIPAPLFGLILLAIAIGELTFGIAALMLKRWAWRLGVVAFSGGIVLLLLQQLVAFNATQLIVVFLYAGVLYYLFTPAVRGAFENAPSTPSNKLITALVVAIPVALIAGIVLTVAVMRLLDRGSLRPATGGGGSGRAASKSSKPSRLTGKVVFHSGENGESKYKIFVMDAGSGSQEQLTDATEWDSRPSWSPDGRRIAFTRGSADGKRVDVFVMASDGSSLTQVTKTKDVREYGSAWSPDGTKFLTIVTDVSDMEGKTAEIQVLGVDGPQQRALTSNDVPDYDPAWSADGSKIAFIRGDFEYSDVMVMNSDGSNVRKLTEVRAMHRTPAWSPDGERIAYSRGSLEAGTVCVMDADGSGERELTSGQEPVWSPDGEWIMFADQRELHVIRPDGTDRKQLTTNGIEERSPSWRAER